MVELLRMDLWICEYEFNPCQPNLGHVWAVPPGLRCFAMECLHRLRDPHVELLCMCAVRKQSTSSGQQRWVILHSCWLFHQHLGVRHYAKHHR